MPRIERPSEHPRGDNEPFQPSPLPPELVDFLKDRPYAALFQPSDQGTILVVKAPLEDIRSVVGLVPIQIRHTLYDHRNAPVIRTRIRIYDDPERPLALECFSNISDEQQRADFTALGQQKALYLLFYDEQVRHRLSKQVVNTAPTVIPLILHEAKKLRAAIPEGQFDFDKAKADIQRQTNL